MHQECTLRGALKSRDREPETTKSTPKALNSTYPRLGATKPKHSECFGGSWPTAKPKHQTST